MTISSKIAFFPFFLFLSFVPSLERKSLDSFLWAFSNLTKSGQVLRAYHLFPQGSALRCSRFVPWTQQSGGQCWCLCAVCGGLYAPSLGVHAHHLWRLTCTIVYMWNAGDCTGQLGMQQVSSFIGFMGKALGGVWEPISRTLWLDFEIHGVVAMSLCDFSLIVAPQDYSAVLMPSVIWVEQDSWTSWETSLQAGETRHPLCSHFPRGGNSRKGSLLALSNAALWGREDTGKVKLFLTLFNVFVLGFQMGCRLSRFSCVWLIANP